MTHLDVTVGSDASQALPMVRKIGMRDLKDALAKGIEDFRAIPTHVIFLSLIYPVGALIVAQLTLNDLVHLFFPLAAGFALIGPVAALGLYELSRRRELGLDLWWTHAFDVRHARSLGGILALGALLVVIFLLWVAVSQAIYTATFGYAPPESISEFPPPGLHDARGLDADRRRQRRRLSVRRRGVHDQRCVIPAASRSQCRRGRCDPDIRQSLFYFSQRNLEPGSPRNDDRELRRPLASPVCEEFFPLGHGAHRFLAIAQWFVHLSTHPQTMQ